MVKRGAAFETIEELLTMQRDLSSTAIYELRSGDRPNPRRRIEAIIDAHPNQSEHFVSSGGGNYRYLY